MPKRSNSEKKKAIELLTTKTGEVIMKDFFKQIDKIDIKKAWKKFCKKYPIKRRQ